MPERKDETGIAFLDPNFTATINHPNNKILIKRVTEIVYNELTDPKTQYDWMNASSMIVTRQVIEECAKCSWRGFKSAYITQRDEAKKTARSIATINLWQQLRRKEKCKKLMNANAIQTYKDKHGVDPTALLGIDLMSDEASGPEDGEDKLEWKRRMAEKLGMIDVADNVLEKLSFFEIIRPNWRSEAYTEILHELWEAYWDTLPAKQKEGYRPRIRTDHFTDQPPMVAPYNFGINQVWFNEHKETYQLRLHDWYTFPDPPGFSANANPVDGANEGAASAEISDK
ncbi:hypothetical protein A0H81_14653 [Grifola frondosa]|uniref:Uncharacterized protein n=1 Tax=Grifola frondosa TaxID=5627 RepID=A0A1C7LKW4_GRIFR|nr:hypothetical protein A0H81_14653 [Grifola frondosa]